MTNFWDERYSANEYAYGTNPNTFFKEELSKLAPGQILMPCEGEGRNAVFAGKLGWNVDAFDTSIEGQKKAFRLADSHGIKINYNLLNALQFIPEQKYNAVGLTFCHFHPENRTIIHRNFADSLLQDGLIILEAFNKKQMELDTGGPKDINMLFSVDELAEDFKELEILKLEELIAPLDEGRYHSGEAQLIRLLARKK